MAGPTGRLIAAALLGVAAGAGAASAGDPIGALTGRFGGRSTDGAITVAEIVRVGAAHAYIGFDRRFADGGRCAITGIGRPEGDALVYRGPPDDAYVEGHPCVFTLRRRGAALVWDDGGDSCRSSCDGREGRNSFGRGALRWSSRRPIRNLARLRRSDDYWAALIEWRKGW